MATPRKRAAPKAADPQETVEERPVGPVRIGNRAPAMVDVFELAGVMYQAPAEPSALLVHDYLQQLRKAYRLKNATHRSSAIADASESYIKAILGDEAWQALRESPLVTATDVAAVIDKIGSEIGLPAVEKVTGALGNS